MTSLSNIKIGRKIALVLGGIVLLLAGLSVLSLWGTSSNEKASTTVVQRLTKARLAEVITGESAAVAQALGTLVLAGKTSDEALGRIAESRKIRAGALDQFKAMADTPTSVKHGADMNEGAQTAGVHVDSIIAMLKAHRVVEAAKEFHVFTTASFELRSKAKEAAQFQETKAADAEKAGKQTASTIWISLVAGSLIAIAAAIFGGVILGPQHHRTAGQDRHASGQCRHGRYPAGRAARSSGARRRNRHARQVRAGHVGQPARGCQEHDWRDSGAVLLVGGALCQFRPDDRWFARGFRQGSRGSRRGRADDRQRSLGGGGNGANQYQSGQRRPLLPSR